MAMIDQLLLELKKRNISVVWKDDDRLHITGSKGSVTEPIKSACQKFKKELLAIYKPKVEQEPEQCSLCQHIILDTTDMGTICERRHGEKTCPYRPQYPTRAHPSPVETGPVLDAPESRREDF